MATFPLPARPAQSYRSGGLAFANDRGGVLHAACDLIAAAGTEVYAVEDGTVIYGPRRFFESGPHIKDSETGKRICKPDVKCLWVYDLLVKHSNFLVRYGEIGIKVPPEIQPNAQVKEGQLIGYVGAQTVNSMLHLEMYSNPEDISYPTVMDNMKYLNFQPKKTFHRRKDLMNPTAYLDSCIVK